MVNSKSGFRSPFVESSVHDFTLTEALLSAFLKSFLNIISGEFPCKFYVTGGTCYAGDNCKFSHASVTKESQQLVLQVYEGFQLQ